ncbi:MAG: NUDIX hydrolase [Deltaproteobacteria bacterium]|nr:NUDIX hydrolase [Deltaproteobacteria bacterium]MBW2352173.1 NUDIX hydrolase [Deltaproteobacteria bacterium]
MKQGILCPHCGNVVEKYKNPFPTVDIIIEISSEMSPDKGIHNGAGSGFLQTGILHKRSELSRKPGRENAGPSIVLIKRKNPPHGWALPGGFVDYGESLESAARREAEEETSLKVELLYQLGAYSDPSRDPRHHTISVVFVGRAKGRPRAADDALDVGIFDRFSLPKSMAFDHKKILKDYFDPCHIPD